MALDYIVKVHSGDWSMCTSTISKYWFANMQSTFPLTFLKSNKEQLNTDRDFFNYDNCYGVGEMTFILQKQ